MNAVKDLFNRMIRITDERIQHIRAHHPELNSNDFKDNIIKTLQEPEYVIASVSDETVQLFYKYFLGTPVGNKWLCVVVKNLTTEFFVITLYYTDAVKKGATVWKKI